MTTANLFEPNQLYTTLEIMERASVSRSTVLALEEDGRLPVIKIAPRCKRFNGATLNVTFAEAS